MEFASGPCHGNFVDATFDWDNGSTKMEDLAGLLDLEANIAANDLMKDFDDLDLPVLDNTELAPGSLALGDPWRDLSDGSDSGVDSIECLSVKQEPGSPTPSHSSDSSGDSNHVPMDLGSWTADLQLDQLPCTPPGQPHVILKTEPSSPAAGSLPVGQVSSPQQAATTVVIPSTGLSSSLLTSRASSVPVNQVLNSKVKIQPKPTAVVSPKPPASTNSSASKPLVLTAEEFARLTAQGVLKFQNPISKLTSVPTSPIASSMPLGSTTLSADADIKALKRQQRMIKNRESASLSRKRKKEYLSTLEVRLKESACENERLRSENTSLKRKIDRLQSENEQLKKQPAIPVKKVAACLLAVSFMITLNLGPLGLFTQSSQSTEAVPPSIIHHGRTLLSLNDNVNDDASLADVSRGYIPSKSSRHILRDDSILKKRKSDLNLVFMQEAVLDTDTPTASVCPMYFNSTESQRLAKELTGWVLGHNKQEKIKEDKKRKAAKLRRRKEKKHRPLEKIRAAVDKLYQPHFQDGRRPYEVQVFSGADRRYMDFMDAIHRRNDTFYVVSFSGDHLLLPATAHNKTMRPRMSLVMPAVSLNETMKPAPGQIAMMQIDCEVMNTKLVHLSRSAVPDQAKENTTHQSMLHEHKKDQSVFREGEGQQKWQPRRKSNH